MLLDDRFSDEGSWTVVRPLLLTAFVCDPMLNTLMVYVPAMTPAASDAVAIDESPVVADDFRVAQRYAKVFKSGFYGF